MARVAREDIDRIREAIDFQSLVEEKVDLRRAGMGRMTGLCPFHDERTPSFSVNVDDKLFHCFGCGEGGDLFRYVEMTEGVDFAEALQLLADRAGIELKAEEDDPATIERRRHHKRLLELLDRTARYYERQFRDSQEGAGARAELARRGLDPALLETFRVGYAPSAWDSVLVGSRHAGYKPVELLDAGLVQRQRGRNDGPPTGNARIFDRFRRRIMFPLADRRGRILGFGGRAMSPDQKPKYVNTADGGPDGLFHKGQHVYAAHLARPHAARTGEVVLCEGYTDVIALHQSGIQHAVGLMGTALTPDQVGELKRLASTVVLALDGDEAGRRATLRAAELCKGSGLELRVVRLGEGSDPADLLVAKGTDAVRAAFERPISIGRFRVDCVLDDADLTTAEGKDRAIADLRPVFATIPAGVLRMELVGETARRLRLDPDVLGSLIGGGGTARAGAAASAAPPRAVPSAVPGPAAARAGAATQPAGDVATAELAFLAECHAVGAEAAAVLAAQRVDVLFAHEAHREAARALQSALAVGHRPASDRPAVADALERVAQLALAVREPSLRRAELVAMRLELATIRRVRRSGPGAAAGQSPEALHARQVELQERLEAAISEEISRSGKRRAG